MGLPIVFCVKEKYVSTMAKYSLDPKELPKTHDAFNFDRILRYCELNRKVCYKAIGQGATSERRPVLTSRSYTFDGALWVPKRVFDLEAPDFLKKSRRSLEYGERVILRGTRYTISANPTFEVRQKLHDLEHDFVEGLKALRRERNQIFALAVADYVKNSSITFLNSLISGEKIGKFGFTNFAYQDLRKSAQEMAGHACDLFYGLLILNEATYSKAYDWLVDNGERVLVAVKERILHEYREGTFSSRHITRPEASHPLIIGGFALRLVLDKRVDPEVIVGMPAGATELCLAVRTAYRLFRGQTCGVTLIPASVHSIKHDYDEAVGSAAVVDKLVDHFKGKFRDKRLLVVDDNSSTGQTLQIVSSQLETCRPSSCHAFVAEADIMRSKMRIDQGDVEHIAAPRIYGKSLNVLPISKKIFPRVDLKQINERRRMISCVRKRYSRTSENPIISLIGDLYVDLIKCPNHRNDVVGQINSFRKTFLSNFYEAKVQLGGVEYNSVEHAYQRAKVSDRALEGLTDEHLGIINKRLANRNVSIKKEYVLSFFSAKELAAGTSKVVGNQLRILGYIREDWDHVKLPIMVSLLVQKFSEDSMFRLLRETEGKLLVEGNDWGDTFWGVDNNRGRNVLGRVLMIIRNREREELERMCKDIVRLGVPNFDVSQSISS